MPKPPDPTETGWTKQPLPFEEGRHYSVNKETGCYEWERARNGKGYGVSWNGETKKFGLAHRVAYETQVGPIGPDYTIDHLCRNPRCLNPEHLEQVTRTENLYRQARSRREELAAAQKTPGTKFDTQGNILVPVPLEKAAFIQGQVAFLMRKFAAAPVPGAAQMTPPKAPPVKIQTKGVTQMGAMQGTPTINAPAQKPGSAAPAAGATAQPAAQQVQPTAPAVPVISPATRVSETLGMRSSV